MITKMSVFLRVKSFIKLLLILCHPVRLPLSPGPGKESQSVQAQQARGIVQVDYKKVVRELVLFDNLNIVQFFHHNI